MLSEYRYDGHQHRFEVRRGLEGDIPTLIRHRELMWREIGKYTESEIGQSQAMYGKWLKSGMDSGLKGP
ncbi:MAG: hypothetical protein M1117_01135 [Candidatus Thermoplasmatota archaeon]|nr:hypothetical protein [Candidatus Thermoplasmatota archaeon]